MDHSFLQDAIKLLAMAVAIVILFRRLQLPAILGYLFIGILTGTHGLGWVENTEATQLLGEIGVVFLLFTIGLEFSIPRFLKMWRTLLGLGGSQVLIGTVSGMAIAVAIGADWEAALIVGGALALSSTAIVIKQLTDQLELHQPHGNLAVGILLFQDMAAVPFLVMIPILAAGGEASLAGPLTAALLKGAVALVGLLLAGRWLLRPAFHEVARARSAELFTLSTLLVALAAAGITAALGLSLALGAFLAGMTLGETEYRHQIEADIRPFRDVLLGLFFITVGMDLNLRPLLETWHWVALLTIGVIFGKGAVIVALARLGGYRWESALRAGLALGQGSEFGIALLAVSLDTGLMGPAITQPVLTAIIVSMTLSPLLVRFGGPLVERLTRTAPAAAGGEGREAIAEASSALRDHVVICGYGHIGQNMARFLRAEDIQYIGLDTDPEMVNRAWARGERVFYGDATHPDILEAARLDHAKAVVVTFENLTASRKILQHIRRRGCEIPVIVRTHDDTGVDPLLEAGATEVVPEDIEASIMLTAQLMTLLDVPIDDIMRYLRSAQRERYPTLRASALPSPD